MHLVFPTLKPKYELMYPTNTLRNTASQLVVTKWTFVLDADLLPNAPAAVYQRQVAAVDSGRNPEVVDRSRSPTQVANIATARTHSRRRGDTTLTRERGRCGTQIGGRDMVHCNRCRDLHMFIPQTFQLRYSARGNVRDMMDGLRRDGRSAPCGSATSPCMSKGEAICMLKRGQLTLFYPHFENTYIPSDPATWVATDEPYVVSYTKEYEPYFITESGMPPFNEQFQGRLGDKAQHTHTLHAAGYNFVVLPEVRSKRRPSDHTHRICCDTEKMVRVCWVQSFVIDQPHGVEKQAGWSPIGVELVQADMAHSARLFALDQSARSQFQSQSNPTRRLARLAARRASITQASKLHRLKTIQKTFAQLSVDKPLREESCAGPVRSVAGSLRASVCIPRVRVMAIDA